jgi:hypothetical protein
VKPENIARVSIQVLFVFARYGLMASLDTIKQPGGRGEICLQGRRVGRGRMKGCVQRVGWGRVGGVLGLANVSESGGYSKELVWGPALVPGII